MKKIFKVLFGCFLFLILSLLIFLWIASRPIPDQANTIIDEVLGKEIPEQILGDTSRVQSGDWEIWYESISPIGPVKGTILLIMGLGGNALEWSLYFTKPLVDAGYHVIRFDNRNTGLSSWKKDDFTLSDMTEDALAVLDALHIDSAHVVGLSMGGMIAQMMAIHHPERVETMTCMFVSGNLDDPELPSLSKSSFISMVATGIRHGIPRKERNIIQATISVRSVMAFELSEKRIRALAEQSIYNQRFRRGFNPDAFLQQSLAVKASGSRYEDLRNLKLPVLVIHGKEDPLIPVEHGIKTAAIIPNAKLKLIEGMGHDLSPEHTPQMHQAILDLLSKDGD